jgi:hypothetical protein
MAPFQQDEKKVYKRARDAVLGVIFTPVFSIHGKSGS